MTDAEWTGLLRDCARQMGVDCPVRLLRCLERAMPMALGVRRPAILIPAVADNWADDRRRAVLLHELAHIAATIASRRCSPAPLAPSTGSIPACGGRAAASRRTRALLRRPRADDRHRGPRLRRAPARDRLHARRPPLAGARRQHGPARPARRAHARGARCRPQSHGSRRQPPARRPRGRARPRAPARGDRGDDDAAGSRSAPRAAADDVTGFRRTRGQSAGVISGGARRAGGGRIAGAGAAGSGARHVGNPSVGRTGQGPAAHDRRQLVFGPDRLGRSVRGPVGAPVRQRRAGALHAAA